VPSGKRRTDSATTSSKTNSRSASAKRAEPDPEEPPIAHGKVAHILRERGYGFIRCIEGEHLGRDFFFHYTALDGDLTLDELQEGEFVTFEIKNVPKGLRAERVQREA
jgi:cold shock CspA family protein